jgi:hypothetical protein
MFGINLTLIIKEIQIKTAMQCSHGAIKAVEIKYGDNIKGWKGCSFTDTQRHRIFSILKLNIQNPYDQIIRILGITLETFFNRNIKIHV